MTKIIVMPSKINIDGILNKADSFLFGIKGFSVNMPIDININELEELSSLLKINNKELFISLNKNIHNGDLEELKVILKKIDSLDIKGIFYADVCFINLKNSLDLKTPLVWSNEHLTTNYATINFWKSYGVNYTYLSAEITLPEILEIRANTDVFLIVPIFGHLPMFVSERHAVKNYLDNFNLSDGSNINYIEKEEKVYPIIDNELGTTVYSSYILNGLEEYKLLKEKGIDYVTLSSFNIDDDLFLKVLDNLKTGVVSDFDQLNMDKGFLYKETVYKVK